MVNKNVTYGLFVCVFGEKKSAKFSWAKNFCHKVFIWLFLVVILPKVMTQKNIEKINKKLKNADNVNNVFWCKKY